MAQLGEEKSFKALNKYAFLAVPHSIYKYPIKNVNPCTGKCNALNNFNQCCSENYGSYNFHSSVEEKDLHSLHKICFLNLH